MDKRSEHYSSERGMSPPGKTSGGHEISGTDEMGALPARARFRKNPRFLVKIARKIKKERFSGAVEGRKKGTLLNKKLQSGSPVGGAPENVRGAAELPDRTRKVARRKSKKTRLDSNFFRGLFRAKQPENTVLRRFSNRMRAARACCRKMQVVPI